MAGISRMGACDPESMRKLGGLWLALSLSMACLAQHLSFGSLDARTDPEWMNRLTIYEIWLNAFSQEGTLRAAIPRLEHVSELGASVAYLGPITKRSPTPHSSPYNIADYNAIDPQYGNEQDLRDFVSAAHKLNLKVMLDVVYYHTGARWRDDGTSGLARAHARREDCSWLLAAAASGLQESAGSQILD